MNPRCSQWFMLSVLGCLLLCGCATVAGRADYGDYRQIQIAQGDEAKLLARARYVAQHPEGMWAEDVRQGLADEEEMWFERGHGEDVNRAALQRYIAAYPSGQFVEAARAELEAIRFLSDEDVQQERETRQLREEQRLALVAEEQGELRQKLMFWVDIFSQVDLWRMPIEEAVVRYPELDKAFAAEPRPVCSPSECVKRFSMAYTVVQRGATALARSVEMLVRVHLVDGHLLSGEILLSGSGWARWYELETQQRADVVDADSNMAQRQANTWNTWAMTQIKTFFGSEWLFQESAQPEEAFAARVLGSFQREKVRVDVFSGETSEASKHYDGILFRVQEQL